MALSCSFPWCHIKQSGTKTPLTRTHASYPHVHVLSAAGRSFTAVKCCLSPGQEKRLSDWPVLKEPQQLLSPCADKRMLLSGWWWTCSSLSEDRYISKIKVAMHGGTFKRAALRPLQLSNLTGEWIFGALRAAVRVHHPSAEFSNVNSTNFKT